MLLNVWLTKLKEFKGISPVADDGDPALIISSIRAAGPPPPRSATAVYYIRNAFIFKTVEYVVCKLFIQKKS